MNLKWRKSSIILMIMGWIGFGGIGFLGMSAHMITLEATDQTMDMKTKVSFVVLSILCICFPAYFAYSNDRKSQISKAEKDGFETLHVRENGNRILMKQHSKQFIEIAEYDTRGYCIEHRRYHSVDLEFMALLDKRK